LYDLLNVTLREDKFYVNHTYRDLVERTCQRLENVSIFYLNNS